MCLLLDADERKYAWIHVHLYMNRFDMYTWRIKKMFEEDVQAMRAHTSR